MSDIFISYAKEDREWVVSLADVLRQQGWTVWWDRSIPFGQSFQEVIEKELNEAQCVIVVWSRHSVGSGWVSAEADEARNRNIMVPVLINDVSPPLVFRQLQTANLENWEGDTTAPVFRKLSADIAALLGESVTQSRFSQPAEPEPDQKKPHKWFWATGLAGVIAIAALLFPSLQEPTPSQAPTINEFRVESSHINSGGTSNLIWNTSNASSVEIRELGEVAHSGSTSIRPKENRFYTLIAKNNKGETTQKTVEIIVENEQKEIKVVEDQPDPQTLVSMFNESIEEGHLDLAEQFLKKAISMAPDHPEVVKIKDKFEAEKQSQRVAEENQQQALAEQERLAKEEKARILEEQLAVQKQQEEEEKIAEEMGRKEEADREKNVERFRDEQLQKKEIEKARIAEIKKQEEADRIKNEELQRKQQAQKLADQQRTKEEEIRKKAEQEKARIAEQQRLVGIENQKKIEAEKQRQEELEKQKALTIPAPIAIVVEGVDKKFKRYGLLESTLRESVAQQLQTAGFDVVSFAEAKSNKESVVMQLRFKYIERNYGAGELYTYSATTYIFPASSTKGEALWKQRVESMANILELGKVNKEFASNVEKFISDHPGKGLEFKK